MHLDLDNKVVLVTDERDAAKSDYTYALPIDQQKLTHLPGGTKSIGHAIVQSFLNEGAIVHYCSRTEADITIHKIDRAHGAVVDVSQPDQVTSWVERAASKSGSIDVVVANVSALVMSNDPAKWRKAFDTDMMGAHALVTAALPHLEEV